MFQWELFLEGVSGNSILFNIFVHLLYLNVGTKCHLISSNATNIMKKQEKPITKDSIINALKKMVENKALVKKYSKR